MLSLLAAIKLPKIPLGEAKATVVVRDLPIEVFTYKPKTYDGRRMVLVFHGTLRNAEDYRNDSERMAERFGALVVVPKFDEARFPNRRYHRGGILNEDGTAAPKEDWTYRYIPDIAAAIRGWENRPKMPYTLLGHSAGGQFLVRLAGFFDSGADRIVAANPGSDLFPTRDQTFGYGFGGLPPGLGDDRTIRAYLARPLVLYLGTADSGHDEDLDESPEAMAQGPGRYQRGKAAFAYAQNLAKARRWPFRWRLVEAPGVGHDHGRMFDAPEAAEALGFTPRSPSARRAAPRSGRRGSRSTPSR